MQDSLLRNLIHNIDVFASLFDKLDDEIIDVNSYFYQNDFWQQKFLQISSIL